MQYKLKITQVSDNCVPVIYYHTKEDKQVCLYPHPNHASIDAIEITRYGDAYGCIKPQQSYFSTQGDTTIVVEIVPHLENVLPKDFVDKRGRKWETFIDLCYYDMVCVRWADDKSFNNPLSFHFDTTEQAALFVQLLKEAC